MLSELLNLPDLWVGNLCSKIQFPASDFATVFTRIASHDMSGQPLLAWQFMSPGEDILHLGWFRLKWYGLLIATAVLIGVNLSMRLAKQRNI
jgi:phosphatidylglycerol:prolipoprotein diacylglycerol transferase